MYVRDVCACVKHVGGRLTLEGRGSHVVPMCAVARQLLWWAGPIKHLLYSVSGLYNYVNIADIKSV